MQHPFWFILLVCLIIAPVSGKIKFDLDWAQFRGEGETVYLEIYYSAVRQTITHKAVIGGLWGALRIKTKVIQSNQEVYHDSLFIEDFVKSENEINPGQTFAEISQLLVPAGKVIIQAAVTDLVTNSTTTYTDSLQVMSVSGEDFNLSSIEMCSQISPQAQREKNFDKNGLRVIPNASGLYGKSLPRLFYYLEAYNFSLTENAAENSYQAHYRIKTPSGNIIRDMPGRKSPKPGKTAVIYGSLDISELTSGAYKLQIDVTDFQTGQVASAEKDFIIYNRDEFVKSPAAIENERQLATAERYRDMSEAELDRYFQQLHYLATNEEKTIFKSLNETGKRNLIVEFWIKRDPTPETPENELEMRYNQLLKYANETYITGVRKGWESDRGRVLLLYGPPDSKEIQQAGVDTKAYEVWEYYSLDNGVIFVFVDKRRNGDFELVHSTKRGEIYEPEWQLIYARP